MAGVRNNSNLLGAPERTEADLEAWRAEHPGRPDPPKPVEVGLLPLEPGANGIIMERAREYARQHGLDDPTEDEELYKYGKAIHRVLLGVVDPDSDPSAPEPFFDGGIDQLLKLRELGQDGIFVLAEMHETFEEEISSRTRTLSEEDYQTALEEVAGPNGLPFWFSLRPDTQWSFAHTTAFLLRAALGRKSSSGLSLTELLKRSGVRMSDETTAAQTLVTESKGEQ
jgi:hypothetical protein